MTTKLVKNIERRMRAAGMTQKGLALKAGLNETAVRDILQGRSKDPQLSTIISLARVLDCPVDALYGDAANGGLYDRTRAFVHDPSSGHHAEEAAGMMTVEEIDLKEATPASFKKGGRARARRLWSLPNDILASRTPSTSDIRIVEIKSDIMAPDIMSGDHVLLDLADRTPSPAGIFLLWDGAGFVPRRIEMKMGTRPQKVIVSARNTHYAAQELSLKDLALAGRILAKWNWLLP